jgi:hypothetical protein
VLVMCLLEAKGAVQYVMVYRVWSGVFYLRNCSPSLLIDPHKSKENLSRSA